MVVMALQDRIKELLAAGFTKAALARAAGVTPASVTHWVTGDTKEIKGETAARLQMATGFSAAWIATGRGQKLANAGNVTPVQAVQLVPILNKVNAGMYKEIIDSQAEDIEMVPVYMPVRDYTFALRVDGDSMEPGFPHGCLVIVNPEAEAMPNDYVIAMNGDNEATFKQLIKDGGDWYLKPRNPRYPIKPLGTARIIGVVCGINVQSKPGDPTWPV